MNYSRTNPSPRYSNLITQYQTMHNEGEKFLGIPAAQTFPGQSLLAQAPRIKRLIDLTKAETILDYGSGKGRQYEPGVVVLPNNQGTMSMIDYWEVDSVHCYDPCYTPFSKLPEGKFDGVVSTDVLEHCPEEDIPWIIDEIFSYANRFVFANVACYPAKKRLPTGENAHCTIRPLEWWQPIIDATTKKYPNIIWEIWVQYVVESPQGKQMIEKRLGV